MLLCRYGKAATQSPCGLGLSLAIRRSQQGLCLVGVTCPNPVPVRTKQPAVSGEVVWAMVVSSLPLCAVPHLPRCFPSRAPEGFCSLAFSKQMAPSSPALWEFPTCFDLLAHLAVISPNTVLSLSGRISLLLLLQPCPEGFGPQSIGMADAAADGMHWICLDGADKRRPLKSSKHVGMSLGACGVVCGFPGPSKDWEARSGARRGDCQTQTPAW